MTSATSAPVSVPMIATPNRLKNQPTTQPTGLVTYDESPWPRIVWTPQFIDAPSEANVNGFSTRVMIEAAIRTRTNAPSRSWPKNRRSTAPRTRATCQPRRRNTGLLNRGKRNRCTIAGHPATRPKAPVWRRRSFRIGGRLEQVDIRQLADQAEQLVRAPARRQADRDVNLVATLIEPLAADPVEGDPAVREHPRDLADRAEPGDLEPGVDDVITSPEEPPDHQGHRSERGDHDRGRDDREDPLAGPRGHPDGRRHPQARRGRQAADGRSVLDDRAGPEEADARHDLGRDARRIDRSLGGAF